MANYRNTGCMITLFLTVSCGITLSGCGDENVGLSTLVESPYQYKGDKVEVFGEIVDTKLDDTSFLVLLECADCPGEPSLICEFLIDQSPLPKLQDGQWVTISGTVDVLAGIVLLRDCRVVE